MRIKLNELKKIIKNILKEAEERSTISADLDPGEQSLKSEFPKWAAPGAVKQSSPASTKAKQVTAILTKKGLTADAAHKKLVTQQLLPFIEKMDPVDLFSKDADDIATEFASQVLHVNGN